MRKVVPALLALFILATCVSCQSNRAGNAANPAAPAEAKLEIPYLQYTLDNGLDVILHQDRSDPIVAIATLMHVGSNRERPGKTGFAHFFEHMSFNDSENVPQGANRKLIAELGGSRNGGTWTDGTVYYEVVPKDAFEKLMWIDSDRLGYMINTVTTPILEREKQVVKNEIRQRADNQPYGHTQTIIRRHLYPEGHPYSWTVLGTLEDLQSATLEDVKEFYHSYYGPRNATLVIAGDFEIDEAKQLVQKWFGEIPDKDVSPPLDPMPVPLDETKSLYHLDNFAELPEIRITWPTVEQYHDDSYALNALGQILSQGKRAHLYKVLVEEQSLAPEPSSYNDSSELAGSFTVRVRANAGVDLDDVHAAIFTALDRFDSEGFSDKDLERIKAMQETNFYNGISSILGKAFQLSAYNEYAGDPGYVTTDIEKIKAVTREDITRVFNRYLRGQHHVITSFVPKETPDLILTGAVKADIPEEVVAEDTEENEFPDDPNFVMEKTPSSFPRNEPPLGDLPLLTPPTVWTAEADNGMLIYGIEHKELPLVQLSLRLMGGHVLDDPAKAGVANLLAQLLMEGTASKTPEELEDAIGVLGASIDLDASTEYLTLSANMLERNYDQVLALIEEIVLEPRWDQGEFDRLKQRAITQIQQRDANPQQVSFWTLNKLLYGDGHIKALPTDGIQETVEAITLDDLKQFYARNFAPNLARFHITGAIDQQRVLASLAGLNDRWSTKDVRFPGYSLPEPPASPQVYFVNIPGAKQSVIFLGCLAMAGTDPDYYRTDVVNERLGGGSSGRLFQTLRIDKGFTYGAYSFLRRQLDRSAFLATSAVRSNATLESLEIFRNLISDYADTYTSEDLATCKNMLIKQDTQNFETLFDLIGVLQDISTYDLPLDYMERNQAVLNAMTRGDIRELTSSYLDAQHMIYVVVGDAETQLENVEAFGYGEPILLDRQGNPIGATN
ncbi:MAG: pitrilysin family protein [bacterium]